MGLLGHGAGEGLELCGEHEEGEEAGVDGVGYVRGAGRYV